MLQDTKYTINDAKRAQTHSLLSLFITSHLFSRFVSGPVLCGAGHRLEVRCYLGGRARRL